MTEALEILRTLVRGWDALIVGDGGRGGGACGHL